MFPTFCRVTGHSRNLPRPNYFPILPPISPAEAKRYRTSGCRITCNFNPNHNYLPITRFIEENVVKCKITEKSVYEYKYFLQPHFGDCNTSQQQQIPQHIQVAYKGSSNEYFYYELEDKILVLPKSVEKDLNRGVIKDVQISEDNHKIGFRYINTIKEYDLICESTDKLTDLNPVKGKGLKKPTKRKRKKSALLGDLKSIFEKKEKLAEMAEKKATEKIQPDSTKMELIKTKMINVKAPVFGYMDHNNKFVEVLVASDEELPKHVIKGQMKGGIFTPGECINEVFIPGKYDNNSFVPGIYQEGQFLPGTYIEKEVNGKLAKKFVPGRILNNVFTPGQMIKTRDGSRSDFIPGQVLTLDNNVKKFVPGVLIEHMENDVLDFRFVPGRVEEANNNLKLVLSELIETNEGLKFICENVEKDSFEVQTFDECPFDFEYEDVKAAAVICDTLHEIVRPGIRQSSFDLQDGDTRSTLSGGTLTNATTSRKASIDLLESVKSDNETIIVALEEDHNVMNGFGCTTEKNAGVMVVNVASVFEKMKENTTAIIQEICSEMRMSAKETAGVVEQVFQAMKRQQEEEAILSANSSSVALNHDDEMEIDLEPDISSTSVPTDLIFEKVTQQVASIIQPVFAQFQTTNPKCKPEIVARVLKEHVAQEIVESIANKSLQKVNINFDKANLKVSAVIQQICAKMSGVAEKILTNDPVSLNAAEEIILTVIKENALQSSATMSILMDPQKASSVFSTIVQESLKTKQNLLVKKLCAQLNAPVQEMTVLVEKVLQEFSNPEIFRSICDDQTVCEILNGQGEKTRGVKKAIKRQQNGTALLLNESKSTEKVVEECRKLLVEGYNDKYECVMGESEEKAADLLKDHVESQLIRDLNEALLHEAVDLAQLMGKLDVVKELESLLHDDIDYEAVLLDAEVLFILRQLVILKKLMASEKNVSSQGNGESGKMELIRDAEILTEYVFAQPEHESVKPIDAYSLQKKLSSTKSAISGNHFQTGDTGMTVYTEESSAFFSSGGNAESKRARMTTSDPDFDNIMEMEPVELLDNSFAKHKLEMGKCRQLQNQKKAKISLKSAEELQTTTSDELAKINREATLRELIETEEEFVRDLGYVIENYYKALGSGNKLAKYRDMFGSLKQIYEFHQGILLEGFRYYVNEPKMVGRTFLRLERYFDLHAEYISHEEPDAQALLRDDTKIFEYFEDLTINLGDEKSLSDHLKLPLQRINDYQLILQDLIDIQRILKEETTDLEKALDLLLSIPQKISDKKFLSNIEGFGGNIFHLGRLLRHDWFTVTRQDINEVKQRYAFLFKSRILVTKVRKISEERSVFILKDIVKLPEYTLEVVGENKFILRGATRTYIFESPSDNIGVEWTDIIQQCLQPDIAVAQRTEENIKQLKREGSLRRSRQPSVETARRASAVTQEILARKESDAAKGVIIQEISLREAESLECTKIPVKLEKTGETQQKESRIEEVSQSFTKQSSIQTTVEQTLDDGTLETKTTHYSQVEKESQVAEQKTKQSTGKQKLTVQSESLVEESCETSGSVTQTQDDEQFKAFVIYKNKDNSQKESTTTDITSTPQITESELAKVESIKTETAKSEQNKISQEKVDDNNFNSSKNKSILSSKQESQTTTSIQEIESQAKEKVEQVFEKTENSSVVTKKKSVDKQKSGTKEAEKAEKQVTTKVKAGENESVKESKSSDEIEARKLRRRSSVIRKSSIEMSATEKLPTFSKPISSVDCEPGDNATFEAITEVPVIINWLKGNKPLDDTLADRVKITSKDNKHFLTLLNCRNEDGGLYTAKITDEKFNVALSSAVLTVHELTAEEREKKIKEKNSPQFLVKFKDTELLKDTRVSFMCIVKGNPEPSLTFMHDGMILQEESERIKIIKQPNDTWELAIDRICLDDEGTYTVKAENKHGTSEISAKVSIVDEKDVFKGIEGKRLLNPGEEPVFDFWMNGRPFTPDEKLKVLFRDEEDTLALIFQHVTPEDCGYYTCIAQTSSGKISCSAELTVQGAVHQLLKEPCAPTISAELGDTDVNVGGSAMMELKVQGYPRPQVTWYNKDGKEIVADGKKFRFLYEDDESIALIIKNVTKEESGHYLVKAINDLGEAETKGNLIVKCGPKFLTKPKNLNSLTDEKLAMVVEVEANPKADLKWYKDGQLIIASERIKFTELEDGRFQIIIERVTLEDSGAYSVVASNAIGQMSEFWNLVAQQPAKIIRKLPNEFTTDLGSKGNQLNFSVQGVPEPNVTCTSSTGKQLKVDNLGGGEYRVNFDCTERQNIKIKAEVKNEFGSDSSECQVYVRRNAQITSKLQNIEVTEGEDVEMKVKVDAYPKLNKVNWFIDGLEISGKKYEKSENGDEYCLKIKKVEKKEESNKLNVQIKVANEIGQEDECSASITIKCKPVIKKGLDKIYRLEESSKNQELNVQIDSTTFPEPKGIFLHNGKEVNADARIKITKKSSETYNLTFNIVKDTDAGEWSFKLQNDIGETWTKTTVIVEGKPTFKKGLPDQLEIIESEKMEIDVMVQDFCEENTKIVWTLDSDVKLESSEVHNKEDNTVASKIVFVPTAGCQKLKVTATNKYGDVSTTSELIQVNLNPPVIKKPLEREIFIKDGAKDVRLKIEVDGMPPPKLAWTLNGDKISHQGTELIIPVFSAANVGHYTVNASNVAGTASTEGSIKMLQTKPSFISGLQPSYTFKEGLDDLVLSVDVDGSPIPVVTWLKDGVPIDTTDPRVTITNEDGKSTLRVKGVDPKDKGRYSVSIKNPNGQAEVSTNVSVKPTPREPVLLEPLEYPKDINKKEKLQIKTKIDGEPLPSVQFLHNGKPLSPHLWKVFPDGSVILTIDNVQPENGGKYEIQLENEAGKKKAETEPITIHEPPQRPGIEPPLGIQKVVEGYPFAFTASVKGFPLPEITFEKQGGEEIKDIKYDKENKTFEYKKAVAELSDAGKYKLKAENVQGVIASEGTLEVVSTTKEGPKYEPKFIYELCDKSVDEGNELVLLAKVDGNPLPKISWLFNDSPLSPEKYPQSFDGEKAILRIPVAERANQGVYKCLLQNEEGVAESASNVTVNHVYQPPSFSHKFTDQEQIPLYDCKFGARIKGNPTPTVKFFKGSLPIEASDKYKIKLEGDLVQLYVKNCTDEDKGIYTCQLVNSQGTAECKAKLDIVKEISNKPRGESPYFLKTIGNTEVYPGMTAKFTACVGGFPNPEFEWRRGNDKIYETDRIKFERDGAGSGLLRLIIKDVDISDLADYTLKIWNDHGDAECTAYLKYDSLADLNKQKLGELYSGYEESRPTAIPNRPLITRMARDWMTLKWDPCLPHVSRIPCTYLVEMCPVDQPDNWTTIYKGLKNTYCDIEFPNPNLDYKFRIRVQWGQNHISEPSPYAITMRNKFDTRPPGWKPQLVPSIPRSYDLSRPPHDGYTHAPRFLNKEKDYQYAQLGHPASIHYSVYGYEKPTLKFFKDGNEFHPQHTYLDNGLITVFINRMTEDAEAVYECEARNSHGIERQSVYLRRADHPRFITRPQEVFAMSRRSGKISARIYGIPVPDIKIYKDWHLLPLTSETRVRLQIVDIDQYTIDVFVSIEECMARDEGLYSIVATNVAGSINSSAMIHVEESEPEWYFRSHQKGKDVRFRNMNIRNYYDFGDEIGRGTQAIHHHVVERSSGGSYASKTLITKYDPRRKDWIDAEYNIWNGLNHRHLTRLHDAFYIDDTYIFISDICTGGDLLSSLISRDSFTEYEICYFIRQLLEGVEYLHVQNHIAHLSITPLDLLLTHINSDTLRLIDFGLARKYWNRPLEYGHPEFVAPEIVKRDKNVGPWSDMWAIGIITYVLLSGFSPFLGQNDRETLENVKNGTWSFGDRFDLISDQGKDFIKRLLVYDFKDRMDVQTALDHSWFHIIHKESTNFPNILRDGHTSYYYKLKAWNDNASCRTIFRRNPLETAYTDPSRMVYPPNYNEDDDYKSPIPVTDHLKLNGYQRPESGDFINESHYQSGDETYLLQLRDTDFPTRLRQYMKVAASHSPSFQFNVYNNYCDRMIPVIRERRKFTDVADEEVDDEKRKETTNGDGLIWNPEPRRIKYEVGTRLDFQAEADAIRSMKRGIDGKDPIFRQKPSSIVNVKSIGQEVTLKVVTAGDPIPTIQFFKNDMMVLSSGENREIEEEDGTATLKFSEIKETDLTNYKIVARNKTGQIISRFRLRLSDDCQNDIVPESLDYEIETNPLKLSTEEIQCSSPFELVSNGKFGSVILAESSRLLKVCTELEFNTCKKLAHINLFTNHQAIQINSSILVEDNCFNYQHSCNLLHYISSLDSEFYSEQMLMNFVSQIMDGLMYLHWQGLALLNLEPGNVIVHNNQKIKLADFSCTQPVLKIGSRVDCLTEPEFTAPEVLNGESQCMPQTDTWNVGILIYICLSGVSPFLGETEEETRQNVSFVRFRFEHLHSTVSQEAKRLIMLLFKRNPLKRPAVDELAEHRWFQLSDHMTKKREKSCFDTAKIKAYYANYLEKKKSTQDESNLQDFTSKYGTIN